MFEIDLAKQFDSLFDSFFTDFTPAEFKVENFSKFEEKDGLYELKIKVPEGLKPANIKVKVNETLTVPIVKVGYILSSENSRSTFSLRESLPKNADSSTVKAKIDGKSIIVTAEKKMPKSEEGKSTDIPISVEFEKKQETNKRLN